MSVDSHPCLRLLSCTTMKQLCMKSLLGAVDILEQGVEDNMLPRLPVLHCLMGLGCPRCLAAEIFEVLHSTLCAVCYTFVSSCMHRWHAALILNGQ